MMKSANRRLIAFDYHPGDTLLSKYRIIDKLGDGWEGEVYRIQEINTDIERAAKLFFPHRNVKNRTSRFYARKLHKLQRCHILIQYHNEELIYVDGIPVTMLVSEYVQGELLSEFIKRFPGSRLSPFQALHLLYALTRGVEEIHLLNEYHGDLHLDNVIVNHFGLNFELKLLDMYRWGASTRANRNYDLCSLIRIFYDALGGSKQYSKLPPEVKCICCGLKESLIIKRFRKLSLLREYLEGFSWQNGKIKI